MTTMSVTPSPAYIAMPDSVTVADLPPGYPAYLGYVDGEFNTAADLRGRFPAAELVLLTVNGSTTAAHGARVKPGDDVEPGDLAAGSGVGWVMRALAADPASRPVIYASVQGVPGYGMHDVVAELQAVNVPLNRVRLLSAHYGWGPHVCGPDSCRLISVPMDGTQWTSMFKGLNASDVDMSMLAEDFFGPEQTETERLVTELGIVRQGDTGAAVKTVQALCNARTAAQPVTPLKIDGVYGPETAQRVRGLQRAQQSGITVDGVVGPATWPVLLGVA